ncbi:FAD-dependent monooxygenase [Kitasatospora kifunensis]|uniref:Putative polyketide hydroxylase n=1 Tax=Kitasatospora kifunensis TaxID=58351 RepID=A0A7W7VVY2_KITKI|nr:FAD-dependent monooxygenase [Kitasatospora kifunensis]MBB4924882.1 putative polyketide hydroxylase [Kitasatospora kifunensis]
MTAQPQVPVLIVGGSLVGLSTALFLAHQGVPALVVEERDALSAHPRTRGVNPRSMELLRSVGLAERLRGLPSAGLLAHNSGVRMARSLAGPELGTFREEYYREVRSDLSDLSPADWCLCHQNELEAVLREAAEQAGAVVQFGTEFVSCTQDASTQDGGPEGEVTAVVRDRRTGRTREIRARYLVAADGSGSTVRRQLGIPFPGTGQLGRFLAIHFRADLTEQLGDRRFVMCYTFNSQVRGALIPLDNAREWRLDVILDPAAPADDPRAFTPERCTELVRAAAGVPDLAVEVLGAMPWTAAAKVAAAFRVGRVFLAGDAAHVMPPSGAFGSNAGIQDAHNLAWKLAAVLTGQAGPALLDSYHAERQPVCAATVRQAVLRQQDRPRGGDRSRDRGLPPGIVDDAAIWFGWRYRSTVLATEAQSWLADSQLADPQLANSQSAASQVAEEDGVWTTEPLGLPGTRAPHLWLRAEDGDCSTLDLFGAAPVLLTGSAAGHWPAAASAVAGEWGVPLRVHSIGGPDGPTDPTGGWAKAYGVTEAGAVLVRPDGVIAWRSPDAPHDVHAALRRALGRMLGR